MTPAEPPPPEATTLPGPSSARLAFLSLAALGVVYGDIGTSPLYAVRECFHGDYAIAPSPSNILGVLSLMFWALMIIVSTKYLGFVLRADNRGEGGVIALTALIERAVKKTSQRRLLLTGAGLFAASLLYGDGMITPAISVLSAVEGLKVVAPSLERAILPLTVLILTGLFLFQRRGTAGIGALFGPVMIVWFSVIGVLGLLGIVDNPRVLTAIVPWHAIRFLLENHTRGFLVLGSVFLVVTGAEALYADLGHFGRRPIQVAWFFVALPSLVCNYLGQGALLLRDPGLAPDPFYALAPEGWLVPLVILATLATVIASQAVISGAFSLTRQAIQLGYLPRLRILHTSAHEIGQIYIPQVNWILMAATIALVLGFGSSSKLAAAYGVAVTTTMLITTALLFVVTRRVWGWSGLRAGLLTSLLLAVDLSFFGANIGKVAHGAWFPLAIGAVAYAMLTTWSKGRRILAQKLYAKNPPLDVFIKGLTDRRVPRAPGKAVYLAGSSEATPPALLQNLKHNKIVHEMVAVITLLTEEEPRIPEGERVEVQDLGSGFFRVFARYGFMEEPSVPEVLALCRGKGLELELEEVSFFLGRETLRRDRNPVMPVWREAIFAFMSRNAMGATTYFRIPPNRVIEIGTQVEL
jgi:KUP system potassium uptake protein